MTVTLHALWLLCALGTPAFAARAAGRRSRLLAMVAGFVAASALAAAGRIPDAQAAGAAAAVAAFVYLVAPRHGWLAAALGGVVAGTSIGVLALLGLPVAAGVPAMLGVLALTVWLTRTRPSFAPDRLQEEALLGAGLLGLVVAALPGVLDGWQAARNLNVAVEAILAPAIPFWTLGLVAACGLLGAGHAVWIRR